MISGYVFPLVQCVKMNSVDTKRTVCIDLLNGVLDSCLFEALDLVLIEHIEGLAVCILSSKRIREEPVLGNQLAKLAVHYAAVAGKRHVDRSRHVENRHNSCVYPAW